MPGPSSRARRPAAGARHSEERRARFEAILWAAGNASTARAGERTNERLAERARVAVEASSGGGPGG
eukprot:9882135-Alexandrium_andersonii.AAC.1